MSFSKEQIQAKASNYMTLTTLSRLQQLLETEKNAAVRLERSLGDTQDNAQDWHDNFAYDQLVLDVKLAWTRVSTITNALIDPVIIEPRLDTSSIGMGNSVIVQYEDEPEPEKFTILGVQDTFTERSWISFASPLGASLIGKQKGDTVTSPNGLLVKILDVLPGEFS